MDEQKLIKTISGLVGQLLAEDLVKDFIKIRRDYATRTLERAAPGKFVETFVQCLQQLAKGKFDANPNVEVYLLKTAENELALPDGLRICASRVARAVYTFRNKRNIAHKNNVDPNTFDLAFIHQGAAWIMAELVRTASGISMQEAGALIELIQTPVGTLVEEIDGMHLVHAEVKPKVEVLILLHSLYPNYVSLGKILESLITHKSASVRTRLTEMVNSKLIHGNAKTGYRLTSAGYYAAIKEITKLKI